MSASRAKIKLSLSLNLTVIIFRNCALRVHIWYEETQHYVNIHSCKLKLQNCHAKRIIHTCLTSCDISHLYFIYE